MTQEIYKVVVTHYDVAVDQDMLDYEELTDSNRENIQFDKDCKQNAIDLLQHAPTIEPERKNGKWMQNDNGTWSCNQCHSWIPDEQHYYAHYCLF